MKTAWTSGLDKEEATRMTSEFQASGYLRGRLKDILDKRVREAEKERRGKVMYDCPNWELKTSHLNGHICALEEIINLL